MSITGAAQRIPPPEELAEDTGIDVGSSHDLSADPLAPPPFALRQQVAERLAAHRARRAGSHAPVVPAPAPAQDFPRSRSAHIAAAVAERYAQSISYRNFLAAEAERSVRQAEAAADVANINAKAIAYAQQQLLSDLEHWDPDPEDFALGPIPVPSAGAPAYTPLPTAAELHRAAAAEAPAPGFTSVPSAATYSAPRFTVRHYEDAPPPTPSLPERLVTYSGAHTPDFIDDGEDMLLDEEIAFRQDPIFDEFSGEPLPLTANLLEFPRQLIAARKARPRLAEGPLREDLDGAGSEGQLRIFEVDPSQLSDAAAFDPAEPEWSSILLAAHTHTEAEPSAHPSFIPNNRLHTAPLSQRLMATLVDGAILTGSLATFTGVFALTVTHLSGNPDLIRIPLPVAAGAAAAVLLALTIAYYLLFFTVSDATPGMRYARIALCTFSDENPTRSAMRLRLLYTVLSILPIGIGLLWVFLDEDRLGWQDRLSGMYQRSY